MLKYNTNDATKLHLIDKFDTVLSLDLLKEAELLREEETNKPADPEEEEINALVARRAEAKKNKDYKLADEIRNDLAARGIVIEDTPNGAKWRRA